MNVILLSGGSGKRLWPLSNDVRSKQFIKMFKTGDSYESMLQKIYKGIKSINNDACITIATSNVQKSIIKNQLGDVDVSLEPCRKDTFPAILLAACYLYDVKKVDVDDSIVVCPVDPYVDERYFKALNDLYKLSLKNEANLSLIGIEPTHPSEKYGYIIPKDSNLVSEVVEFKEKPDKDTAVSYIAKGALWNAGIFAFKLKYILDIGHKLIDFKDYEDLFNKYNDLNKISFDYAVVEKEKSINVLRFDGIWQDLGTWNTLTDAMEDDVLGNGILEESKNSNIINELKIPVLGVGLNNIIVAASPDGILVSEKDCSSHIKPYVEKIEAPIMYSEKSWGTYQVIDVQDESLTILAILKEGNLMKYHSHEYRDEVWTVIAGNGEVTLDDKIFNVKPGDVIEIKRGMKHRIKALTELKIIEVQLGKDISVEDKILY